MSFECHITVLTKDAALAEEIARDFGWKTSQIARDPVLGDDTYFYLTAHSPDFNVIKGKMNTAVTIFHGNGVQVVREKIEHIVHDRRYTK